MHSPAAAESLPLMREVAKIYLILDGGRETSRENSLPQSASLADSPLVRGGLVHTTGTAGGYDYAFSAFAMAVVTCAQRWAAMVSKVG